MATKTYYCWAEHSGGQSVSHPCVTGIYDDPTDSFECQIVAESAEDAEAEASARLLKRALDAAPCQCQRHRQPNTEAWARSASVIVSATPYPDFTAPDEA